MVELVAKQLKYPMGVDSMVDYDLSKLNSREFEHLIQSLSAKVIGPEIVIFGDGPDGGREATFDGEIPYPTKTNPWNGYGVVQAKFLQRSSGRKKDGDWVLAQLDSELAKYSKPEPISNIPDYFIFVTNVVLTPVKGTGSKDKVLTRLADFKNQHSLKAYELWDYDKIRVLLDNNDEVRGAYTAFLTSGDALALIIERLNLQTPNFDETICSFLQKELLSDEFVNLEQAGHGADESIPLARVFVDLHARSQPQGAQMQFSASGNDPVHREGPLGTEHAGFIKEMLAVSSERLDPQSLAVHSIGQTPEPGGPRHSRGRFVLIGGPGQGKTTVGQFICQIFRASIISQRPPTTLSREVKSALTMIRTHCEEEGVNCSPVPRFPFRIVLNEFASALSGPSQQTVYSVFSYLAQQIRKRTEQEVSADDIKQWLAHYPSLFVFDGLDEVPSSSNRDQVLESIREFWIDATNNNADVLAIATSRPQGYNEDFSPEYYQHQWLVHLDKQLGNHFAKRLVDVRYGTDADRKEKVLGRLERAFESESTSRLMRTPLQVTIMTALVDRMGQPPQARWNLFKAYYDVIYQREVERDIPASELLQFYQPDINAIHNRVALLLQVDSERTGLTDARFSAQRFISLVEERLREEGHEGHELDRLKQRIVDAALERLVFLVGLESDQIGFEVRSLQEFMAAESLMEGSDEDIACRLGEIAPIPNWRNVFLFASGKCFADRQHLRDKILSICTRMNEKQEDQIAGAYLVGSGLAIELIDDGLSRHQPRYVQSFARIALRALDATNVQLHKQLSVIYEPQLEQIYVEEMTRRLSDSRENVRVNVWDCLLHLVNADIKWAKELAEKHWPSDLDGQLRLLERIPDVPESVWATKQLVVLAPQISVRRFRDVFGFTRFQHGGLSPDQEVFLKVLELPSHSGRTQLNFLETRLSYFPVSKISEKESSWIKRFANMQDLHPTWAVYKSVARFLKEPTKECLARELRSVARSFGQGMNTRTLQWHHYIPWPILACLQVCNEESEVLAIADKAVAGDLGNTDDWLKAEKRWFEKGITSEDILSMSDDRLPFDAAISRSGFPTSLSVWPVAFYVDEHSLLRNLLALHSKLPKSVSRSFVANLIDACLLHASFGWPPHQPALPQGLTAETIRFVYDDLPDGHNVSLALLDCLIESSNTEIADFVARCEQRNMRLRIFGSPGTVNEQTLGRLREAFAELPDNTVLLPTLGTIAEHGSLSGQVIETPNFDQLERQDHKAAALLIKMSLDSWKTLDIEEIIGIVQEIAKSTDDIYERVLTTIRENRVSEVSVERFLNRFEDILPKDNYEASAVHNDLLENLLRRRTSQFNDPTQIARFNMPSGVARLLLA